MARGRRLERRPCGRSVHDRPARFDGLLERVDLEPVDHPAWKVIDDISPPRPPDAGFPGIAG
jgi:hypothetical protein